MSYMYFATCEPERAFQFLQKLYPSKTLTKESCAEILALVEQDKLRILDPAYHSGGAIAGNKATDADRAILADVVKRFHEAHIGN